MENQITKGKWHFSLNSEIGGGSFGTNIYNGIDKHPVFFTTEENKLSIKRAKLICETFNVTQETGKTPRQLADENKMLLEALQGLVEKCLNSDGYAQKYTELFNAQQAINKATK